MQERLSNEKIKYKHLITQYETEISRLRGLRDEEAKTLQSTIEEKESVLSELKQKTEDKEKLNRELEEFGVKIGDASEELRRLSEQHVSLLTRAKSELAREGAAIKKARDEMKRESENMDNTKIYLKDLYGKIASYIEAAKETVEWINEYMEQTGHPLRFRVPDGETIEVDMDNFNKQL